MTNDFALAPFPWFGGKSKPAAEIWERFGNPPNFIEPFAGSLAVLLLRPHEPGVETVNDINGHLVNFWRSIAADPEAVARYATWPITEIDLLARKKFLRRKNPYLEAMLEDYSAYDAQSAGIWVWGMAASIASSMEEGLSDEREPTIRLPHLGDAGQGITRALRSAHDPSTVLPPSDALIGWFAALSSRLRGVRVIHGDWRRALTNSVTTRHGVTAVFLDPPYDSEECFDAYRVKPKGLSKEVREWAVENGGNPNFRIALCGYEGEHETFEGWDSYAWKARGGYGNQGDSSGRENSFRERIWFSPHCHNRRLF